MVVVEADILAMYRAVWYPDAGCVLVYVKVKVF